MRRRLPTAVLSIILSCILTGCSLSMPTPTPQKLLSVFTKPFTCGFTAYDGSADAYRAALVRDNTADTLTVYGTYTDTVLYSDGASTVLLTNGNTDIPPLSIPLPSGFDGGITAFLQLFSVLPDEHFTSVRGDGGITVSSADGTYSAVFSEDGTPCRITLNGLCAVIDSFTVTESPISQ